MSKAWALSLVDSDSSVKLGTAAELGIAEESAVVLEFWVKKTESDDALPGIFTFGRCTPAPDELPVDAWVHIAVRRERYRENDRIYVNGAFEDEQPNYLGSGDLLPQESSNKIYEIWHGFRGYVTEYRIWTGDRTDAEIAAGMHRRVAGNEAHLIGCWPMNQSTGQEVTSVKGPTLALSGNAKWVETTKPPLPEPDGKGRTNVRAAGFREDGAHIEISQSAAQGKSFPNGFTVEAWVQPAKEEMAPVVSAHLAGTGWALWCSDSQATMMIMADQIAHIVTAELPPRLPGSLQTVHLAGVYARERVYLYVNGHRRWGDDPAVVQGEYRACPLELKIGKEDDYPHTFEGLVTEVRIWNKAKHPKHILRDVFRRLETHEAEELKRKGELLEYWPLDGSTDDHVHLVEGADWVDSDLAPRLPSQPHAHPTDWRTKAQELERSQRKLEEDLATARKNLDGAMVRINQYGKLQADSKKELANLTKMIESQDAKIKELTENNKQLDKQLKEATKQQVALSDLFRNTRQQIESARQDIAAKGGAYALSDVSMELQMIPGLQGDTVTLPQPKELAGFGNSLSKVKMTFKPHPPPKVKPEEIEVPAVVGMSEIAARRRLAEAGFRVVTDIQALTTDHPHFDQVGRVVNQLPAAHKKLTPDTEVRVFIGQQAPATPGS